MKNTVLLIIDIQNDYFPDGKFPLDNMTSVSQKARDVLLAVRESKLPVIHIQHQFMNQDAPLLVKGTSGVDIYNDVKPLANETVIIKHYPNAFKDTNLKEKLEEYQCKNLVVMGAMAQMCVDATVRAALDFGYQTTIIHDAVASRSVQFLETDVSASSIQASIMWALSFAGGNVLNSSKFITSIKK